MKKNNTIPMVIFLMGVVVFLGIAILGLVTGYMDAKEDAKKETGVTTTDIKPNKSPSNSKDKIGVQVKEEGVDADTAELLSSTDLYPMDFKDVVTDKDSYTITIKDFVEDRELGLCLNAEFANKTEDKTLVYFLSGLAINGIELPSMYMENVEASQTGEYIVPLNCAGIEKLGE